MVTLERLAAILYLEAIAVRLVVVDHLGVRSDEGERCRTEVLEILPSTSLETDNRFQFFFAWSSNTLMGIKGVQILTIILIGISDE